MKRVLKFLAFIFTTGILFHLSCKKEYSCENCGGDSSTNKPPIANAGRDTTIVLPVDSVKLDGSASNDPDGTITAYQWTKISGPSSFALTNSTASTTIVKNLAVGTYKFELKVTDNGGLSAKDTMNVMVDSVAGINHPPVANAGPDQTITLPTNSTILDGSGSFDPDNNIISYQWTKLSGPSSFTISNTNAVQTSVTNLIEGVYLFELKVTDAGFLFDADTMMLTVEPQLLPLPVVCDTSRPKINAQYIPVGELSQAREGMAVGSAGGKIVFAGGYGNNIPGSTYGESSRIDIYDIANNTWSSSELSPGVSQFTYTSPTGRTSIAATSSGDKIFFAGGFRGDLDNWVEYFSNIDIYDAAANTWSTAYMSPGRITAAAAAGNKVVFAGEYGAVSCGNGCVTWNYLNKVDIYDIPSNTWSIGTLSEARGGISAVSYNDKIYFAGGWGASLTDKIDIYDVSANTWSTSVLSEPKFIGGGGIVAGNKIYWAGGTHIDSQSGGNNQYADVCTVEIRDVNTGTISFDNLSSPVNTEAILKDNKIIFLKKSYTSPDFANQFDIYDLNTHSWSIGILPYPIPEGAAIVSVNNTIYIAGGFINNVFSKQVWKLEF